MRKITFNQSEQIKCPYGNIGDLLWVRETFAEMGYWDAEVPVRQVLDSDGRERNVLYYAECPDLLWTDGDGAVEYRRDGTEASHWKPSIFMPRWASRITLEITNVRVKRLQSISADDVAAEGVDVSDLPETKDIYIQRFRHLWDSINAKRGFSWASNPFVWAIDFKRV